MRSSLHLGGLVLLLASSPAVGHDPSHGSAPLDVLLVPYVEGPLGCPGDAVLPPEGWSLEQNESSLRISARLLPLPAFVLAAVDTGKTVQSLVMMEEREISLHRAVARSSRPQAGTAVVGAVSGIHGDSAHGMESSLMMDYDNLPIGELCPRDDGVFVARFERASFPETLVPGRAVHLIFMTDARVPHLLPHPLVSTEVVTKSAYLLAPGEDAGVLRSALDGGPGASSAVPVVLAALAVALFGFGRWGT